MPCRSNRSHGEGFPNSLIEAMTAGLACVVTPVAAVPEIVAGGSALVVEVGNAPMLAEAIDRLARDAALRRDLSLKGQEAVRQRYTPEIVLGTLAAAYGRLLPHHAHAAAKLPA
jgi:glycosyltransferase involved in cell wall biosynthesis